MVAVVGVILADDEVYEMVESYVDVLGGELVNRPEQVSSPVFPR